MANKQDDSNYKDWLKQIDSDDTKENREWYNTPDDKRSDYIESHQGWWKKF